MRGGAGGDEGGEDGASTNVTLTLRDASDGRVYPAVFSWYSQIGNKYKYKL